MTMRILAIIQFCFLFSISVYGQESFNQLDDKGKKHGLWKEYYENNSLRYEGEFEHGKEIGVFKFYKRNNAKHPAATKSFNRENDSVLVQFFDSKGRLESEGNMVNEEREGLWKYYKRGIKDQPIMTETYKNNKLDGWKIIYYTNGKIAEKTHFLNGLKDGELIIYSENGQVLQQYKYKDNRLHGNSKVFDALGNITSEGNYKQGHRDGKWKFYTEGKLDSIQNYPLQRQVKDQKSDV